MRLALVPGGLGFTLKGIHATILIYVLAKVVVIRIAHGRRWESQRRWCSCVAPVIRTTARYEKQISVAEGAENDSTTPFLRSMARRACSGPCGTRGSFGLWARRAGCEQLYHVAAGTRSRQAV